MLASLALALVPSLPASQPATSVEATACAPRIVETRTFKIRQTVTLKDVPADARDVRLWVPIPADGAWQHVLSRRVVDAPAGWSLVHQPESGADVVVVKTKGGGSPTVVVETTVVRQSPAFDLGASSSDALQPELFQEELRADAPLMSATPAIAELAAKACRGETDPRKKVVRLLDAVADAADHYSKDKTKPACGRGAAEDCMTNGGGCCTDLHALFIAAARHEGIPARMQYGYRLRADKADTDYDPSYRCWIETFLPGSGWVPTDVVVADAGEKSARAGSYGTLDSRRVWLWQGRGLVLTPRQSGEPIQTMLCGWAEIDGKPVDVLPAADGTPSKLSRSIRFQELTAEAPAK